MSLSGLRVAVRSLRKQPVFTAVVVLSLAIGISLNTTMYGILDALVRPRIDVRNPENLYRIQFYGDYHGRVDNRTRDSAMTAGMHSYSSITRLSMRFGGQVLEHGQNMHEAVVALVAPNFFDVTGTRPLLGRTFIASDERAEATPIVLTEELADQLFPGGQSPLGQRIMVDRQARIVVGVVSTTANFPGDRFSAWEVAPLELHSMYVRIVRLRPGVTRADLERELDLIAQRIATAAGDSPKDAAFRVHPVKQVDFQVRDFEKALVLAVIAVLLVACANLANIQLARGIGRRRELALRSALGATRKRIVAHLLTESAILAIAGLTLGLVLTFWGARAIIATIPPTVGEYVVQPQFSWRVLAFAIGATAFCVVVIGVLPAITISRTDPNELLKSGAGTGATKRNRKLYGMLVCTEIALALALTSGSVVLVRTWMHMNATRYGFDPGPVVVGSVALRLRDEPQRFSDVLQSVVGRLGAVPQASEIAAAMRMGVDNNALTVDDPGGVREFPSPMYSVSVVTPSYIRALGIPIVKGRDFLDGERDHAAVIVDEQTARALWPNADPVGTLIKLGDMRSKRPFVRVVGVVADLEKRPDRWATANQGLHVRRLGRMYYLPGAADDFVPSKRQMTGVQLLARAEDHAENLPLVIQREIDGWPNARTLGVRSWDEDQGLTRQRDSQRFIASLFTFFAAVGIALAAFGVYGVVAHSVAERRRELGVRVALGASSRDILHAVLRESVVVALAGAALGLFMTKFGVLLLETIVQDEIFNAPLFAGVALLLVTIAAASAFMPAFRATRIDPTESLRHE